MGSKATCNTGFRNSHGKICSFMKPTSPTCVRRSTAYLSSSEPRSGLFPRGIIYSSNIHKTKVIHHLPPGHATESIFLSKQTTKLCILWITLGSGFSSFTKELFLKEPFLWAGSVTQLAVTPHLQLLLLAPGNTFAAYRYEILLFPFLKFNVLYLCYSSPIHYMLFPINF